MSTPPVVPAAKPVVHPKVKAAAVAGVVATVLLAVLSAFGADLPGAVDAAISTVAAVLGGYQKSA